MCPEGWGELGSFVHSTSHHQLVPAKAQRLRWAPTVIWPNHPILQMLEPGPRALWLVSGVSLRQKFDS